MAVNGRDDTAQIREMAEIADRLAKRMNRSFVLDEKKVQAYQNHNLGHSDPETRDESQISTPSYRM